MPAHSYYRGRPACFWIALMTGPLRAGAANPAAVLPAGPRPSAQPGWPKTPGEAGSLAAQTAVWAAWASNWFRPDHQTGPPAPRA